MTQYDGSIRIGTQIEVKQAEKELKSLESSISKTAGKIATLREKMDALKDVKTPTQEYKELQQYIDALSKEYSKLYSNLAKMKSEGKKGTEEYQKIKEEFLDIGNSMRQARNELQSLVDTGKAFTLGSDTEEYAKMSAQMQQLNQQMQSDTQRQSELQSALAAEEERLAQIRASATVSDREIIDLLERRRELLQEIADLERAGVGLGYQEYEEANRELSEINERITTYRNNLSNIPDGFDNMRESARRATQSIDSDISRVSKRVNSLLRILSSSFGLTLGIVGLVRLGKEAVETASDVLEIQNVVDVAFGKMSYKIENFADSAIKNFGLSRLSAKKMGSTFMSMGAAMINSMEDASDMAVTLTGRAADMASYFNTKISETETALQSIYTGETKSLKRYGVVMTEVNLQEYAYRQGINKKISAMTQQEKVMLRYNYVLEKTALAEGDFVRTQDNWANQIRILKEQFKELLSILGSGLITVLNPVVKFLNTVLSMLIAIAKQIGAILSKLFGISIPVADSGKFAEDLSMAAGGADELTDGIEAAGKAAKGALAPFDKLNVLSQDKGGGKGGAGAGGGFEMPSLEMEETEVEEVDAMSSAIDILLERLKPLFDWFTKLKNLFVEGFFDGLGESWKERVDEIIADAKNIVKTLTEIFTDPAVVASARTMIEKIAYALGQVVGSLVSIGITIAQNIVGGIDMYLTQNKEFLKEKLVSIFDITGDIALLIGEACATIAYIFEAFGSESGQQLTANIIGIFSDTTLNLLELAGKFGRDILDCIITPISNNKEGLRTALEGALSVLSEVTGTILDTINHTFKKINEVYDKYFKPFFDSIATGLSELLAKFLEFWNEYMQPILDKWAEMFDTLMKEHIQPMIDNFLDLIGKVVEYLTMVWENTLKPLISWLIEVLAPTVADVCDIVFGVVDTVVTFIADIINGIIEIVEGVIDILLGIAQGDWQRVWDGFAEVIDGVAGVIKGIINAIIGVIEGMANAVVAAINTMIRAINTINFTVPDWIPGVGGKSVGFDIPEINKVSIPRLADGAVLRGGDPFVAILNEQRRGQTNIEAPLATIEKAVTNAINKNGGMGGEITVKVYLGEKDITQAVKTEADTYFRRTGRSLFAY